MRSYDLVAALAARQHGLVERSQAIAAGLPARTFDHLASSYLERCHPGVYRLRGTPPSREQRLLAACLAAGPDAAVSHRAAASSWGLTEGHADLLEIATPRRRWPRLTHVTVHRSTDLRGEHVTRRAGVPTTNPMRTVVDLGAVCPRAVVVDAVERGLVVRLFTIVALEAMVFDVAQRGRNGVGVLRRVLDDRALKAARPDGLLEPRMARLFRRFDLPPYAFQHRVFDADGEIGRIDFALVMHRIAIEVDGFEAHGTPEAMADDFVRQNRLIAAGWIVLRFTWNQVVRQPRKVAEAIRAVLVTASAA